MINYDPGNLQGSRIAGPVKLDWGATLTEAGQPGSGILVFDGAVPTDTCDYIIREFERDPRRYEGKTGYDRPTDGGKRSTDLNLDAAAGQPERWVQLKETVMRFIGGNLEQVLRDHYKIDKFYRFGAGDFRVTHYPPNDGFFCWHTDNSGKSIRRIAAGILYLNDVPEGGETEFWYHGVKVAPKKGRFVMFPTTWNMLHRGCESPHDKYLLVFFFYAQE